VSDAPNRSALWGRVWIDELARSGVRHAVIAPGSRSTPLTLAAAAHPDIEDLSVIDERSAAFFALGLAQASGRPAVVICTSGTAAGNFLPAVMEADRWGVPLLVLTADRPPSLRDAGDSQAADQVRLYGHHVRWFHDPGVPDTSGVALAAARSAASEAWARALGRAGGGRPGPVHLNLPFTKPLEPAAGPASEVDPEGGRPDGSAWRRTLAGRAALASGDLETLAARLAGARRPLVLVGALPAVHGDGVGRRLGSALRTLTAAWPAPVWAEAASQVRLDPGRAATVVGTADALASSETVRRELMPDLVIRLGEAPVGWPLRRWARELAEAGVEQVAVSVDGLRRDPEHAVALQVTADPGLLFEQLAEHWREVGAPRLESGWSGRHALADRAARKALDAALGGSEDLWEGTLLTGLVTGLPEDAGLHVSASLPLRDVEIFLPGPAPALELSFNRGLNGIDGVVSAAAGVAWGRRVPHLEPPTRQVLLIGDVAFAHDLSGLVAAARLRVPFVIVLVDNGGGAIFGELPLAKGEHGDGEAFRRHFTTAPGLDVEALCRGVGALYAAPTDLAGFRRAIADALTTAGPAVVHVRVDGDESRRKRRRVIEEMATAAEASLGDG
jgi:2-succinyl-5-enolpyruvyl-6-hydroxy-3-cyclohexene-1-carboxylate synthase